MDLSGDGFITVDEWNANLDNYIKLSQPVKDGFFAACDKLKIGMIDYNNFLKVMNKSFVQEDVAVEYDNFNWEMEMQMRMRRWFLREKLSVEDAWRTVDKNYNGEIKEKDLEVFLIEMVKVKEDEITQGKINRLYKLLDQYKRGRVKIDDFRRFLTEDYSIGQNKIIMGHKNIENYSSFDWKLNAK